MKDQITLLLISEIKPPLGERVFYLIESKLRRWYFSKRVGIRTYFILLNIISLIPVKK